MPRTAMQKKIIKEKDEAKLHEFFPDVDSKELWTRKTHRGFTTLPKTMPLIMVLMDGLESGQPMSSTYLSLWCLAWDGAFLQIRNEKTLALESGFSGERAVTTWKKRMRLLQQWGFIEARKAEHEFSFVLIINPHIVLEELKQAGKLKNDELFSLLKARDIDLSAGGFTRTHPVPLPAPSEATA